MIPKIAIAYGINPHLMDKILYILRELRIKVAIESIEMGDEVYRKLYNDGLKDTAWETFDRTQALLCQTYNIPLGCDDAIETIVKKLNLYACIKQTDKHIIIHSTSFNYSQCIKYAFDYAIHNNYKSIHCCDTNFIEVFYNIAKEYPDINAKDYSKLILDDGSPKIFITSSDNSALNNKLVSKRYIGDKYAIFSQVHQDSEFNQFISLLYAAVNLLNHIGEKITSKLLYKALNNIDNRQDIDYTIELVLSNFD